MPLWQVSVDDGVAVARYDNPPMNYLTGEGGAELFSYVDAWRDPSIRAVVITSAVPDRFITHFSVEELVTWAQAPDMMANIGTALIHGGHASLRELRDLAKPVIVGMTGDTMGGGLELSLACDIRVARAGNFRYGFPEATLGILPGGGGTQRLARLIGVSRAVDFILRGRIVGPDKALELGIVHEVCDDPAARAVAIGRDLADLSGEALKQIKRAVYQGSEVHLDGGLDIEADAFVQSILAPRALQLMQEYLSLEPARRRDWLERKQVLMGDQ